MLPRITNRFWSDDEMLTKLRRLCSEGRLTEQIILDARGMPATSTLITHFGSYKQMYAKIGYHPPDADIFRGHRAEFVMRLRRRVVRSLTEMFPDKVFATRLPGGRDRCFNWQTVVWFRCWYAGKCASLARGRYASEA